MEMPTPFILSIEEAETQVIECEFGCIYACVNRTSKKLYLTSTYGYPSPVGCKDYWTVMSLAMPALCVPRPEAPDGVCHTVDQLLQVFFKDFEVIEPETPMTLQTLENINE